MLDSLITSKMRIKLLLKFFINTETKAYLRGLAGELQESTNAVRVELNRLQKAGLLEISTEGRTKMYRANKKHPLFADIKSLVKKNIGLDRLENDILPQLGPVEAAFVTGDYARGIDSGVIDLVIIGRVNKEFLQLLIDKTEKLIKRKIRTLILDKEEFEGLRDRLGFEKALTLWDEGFSLLKEKQGS